MSASIKSLLLFVAALQYACANSPPTSNPVSPSPSASRTPPAVEITGEYDLTFIASPSCATVVDALTNQPTQFPESVRMRRYPAQVTQDPLGNVQMVLRRGECDPCSDNGGGTLKANLSGRELMFSVPGSDICAGGDYWWESLSPDREWFEVCGNWAASVDDPQQITGLHVGTFAYHHQIDPYVSPTPQRVGWVDLYCKAADHHFTLTKTTGR
jgi:hypothetical protein